MKFLVAVIVGITAIGTAILFGIVLAPAMFKTTDALGTAIDDMGSEKASTKWDFYESYLNNIYGVIVAIMVISGLIFIFLNSQREEYATAGAYY